MKPIHKFNNGNGATLCHNCRIIINEGMTNDLYCEECKKKLPADGNVWVWIDYDRQTETYSAELARNQADPILGVCNRRWLQVTEKEWDGINKAVNTVQDTLKQWIQN